MALTFRRGREEIKKVADERNSGGGGFTPFLPNIYWKENNEEKYLLFLNDIDSIPRIDVIGFIPDGNGRYNSVIARTDTSIGQSRDPLVEDWDGSIKKSCAAIAVELEPTFEEIEGRLRPRGFQVATREFDRKVRNEDGEATGEVEEVTAPVVGLILQHATTLFGPIESYDTTDYPIHLAAVKIKRVGTDNNTSYNVSGYPDLEVDLSNLLDNVDGISYLNQDEAESVKAAIDGLSDIEAGQVIGGILLDKQLEELGDQERYDKIYKAVDASLDRFGNKKKATEKRVSRPSQMREKANKVKETEEVTSTSPAKAKLEEMRKRGAAKRATSEATEE
jgi:hypothetical protein